MRTVRARRTLAASVHEAEQSWYDVSGWPAWVDGLGRVVEVSPGWPAEGAHAIWDSGPAGRGRVTETVVAYEPLSGQRSDVRDDSISGVQAVAFTPVGDEVEVTLSLEYRITQRSLFTGLVDLLFIRRAMERSLEQTLMRFGVELAERLGQAG
jgi:uncharacterized membrane protein